MSAVLPPDRQWPVQARNAAATPSLALGKARVAKRALRSS